MSRIIDTWRRLRAKEVSAIKNADGSFIQTTDNNWHVVLSVPLEHMFDWITPSDDRRTLQRHIEVFRALHGHLVQLEVLPLPLTVEERAAQIRAAEKPLAHQRRDPDWNRAREADALAIAQMLQAQDGGDLETHGLLIITLGSDVPEAKMAEAPFAFLGDEKRFHLDHFENAGLINAAQGVLVRLQSAWPGIKPASGALVDKALMQMIWPGQSQLAPPLREVRVLRRGDGTKDEYLIRPSTEYIVSYYGHSDYDDSKSPYEVEVDYYGRKTYVSCLPLRTPLGLKHQPNSNLEYAFQTFKGRRIRFSWKFRVTDGKLLLAKAGRHLNDIRNHASTYAKAGGHVYDLKTSIQMSEGFYEHLSNNGIVVEGRPMLIAAAPSPEELLEMRESLRFSVGRSGCFQVDDNQIQRKLLLASLPGAKWLDRYNRMMGIGLAAASMPFVTSAMATKGPDFFGFTMGKEFAPVFDSLDAALRLGNTGAPVWCAHGPSRRGKTTAIINLFIPLARRGGYVCHIFDLAKFDVALLDRTQLPPDLKINMINLMEHPGSLNPVLLSADKAPPDKPAYSPRERDEIRINDMANHLRKCCGRKWRDDWTEALQRACSYVLTKAYTDHPGVPQDKVIPSLFRVIDRLASKEGGFAHEGELLAALREPLSLPEAALSCSNESVQSFLDELSEPGLHFIQQRGLSLPDYDLESGEYEPRHHLAMATLDLAGLLSLNIAQDRDIPVAIAHIEFNRTSRLSKGANIADYLARVGGSLGTITAYDTQLPTDLASDLRKQVTGWLGFTPNSEEDAENALKLMGLEATAARKTAFMSLTNPGWNPEVTDGINKGGVMMRPQTAQPAVGAVQLHRWYVGKAFLTDRSERDAAFSDGTPSSTSTTDPPRLLKAVG